MNHEHNPVLRFSQREIVNTRLLDNIVRQSSINRNDLVYDIGAGSGAITRALLKTGARVVAVEKDEQLFLKCRCLSLNRKRLTAIHGDARELALPVAGDYKIFANIPFYHTAEIVRILLFGSNPPEDCYLVLQKEAAEKYAGIPGDTLLSLLIKPVFWTDILHHLDRKDFYPVPAVDIVLFQAERRKCRLVDRENYGLYRDFIVHCRESGLSTVKKALQDIFTYPQVKQASGLLGFRLDTNPTDLGFNQYLALFQFFLGLDKQSQVKVTGAEARFLETQANRVKIHRTVKRNKN